MKKSAPTYRCPLGRLQPEPVDIEAVKQRGWRDQRILVVSATDQRLTCAERQFVRRIGERLYGAAGSSRG